MKGIVTGSFDPITLGHIDIIERASKLCDSLVVGVFNNIDKRYMFDLDMRVELVKLALNGMDNVSVYGSSGMVVDFCHEYGIDVIIRGFRNQVDYAYEVEMAEYNYREGGLQTYLLPTKSCYSSVSSSVVRERIASGQDLSEYLPESIINALRRS